MWRSGHCPPASSSCNVAPQRAMMGSCVRGRRTTAGQSCCRETPDMCSSTRNGLFVSRGTLDVRHIAACNLCTETLPFPLETKTIQGPAPVSPSACRTKLSLTWSPIATGLHEARPLGEVGQAAYQLLWVQRFKMKGSPISVPGFPEVKCHRTALSMKRMMKPQ